MIFFCNCLFTFQILGKNDIYIEIWWDTVSRAHQTRRSGQNSCPISTEVTLPLLKNEIKVALFLFVCRSFHLSSIYHHSSCEFESHSSRSVLDTTLFVSDLRQPHDITEILLKVALNTIYPHPIKREIP